MGVEQGEREGIRRKPLLSHYLSLKSLIDNAQNVPRRRVEHAQKRSRIKKRTLQGIIIQSTERLFLKNKQSKKKLSRKHSRKLLLQSHMNKQIIPVKTKRECEAETAFYVSKIIHIITPNLFFMVYRRNEEQSMNDYLPVRMYLSQRCHLAASNLSQPQIG